MTCHSRVLNDLVFPLSLTDDTIRQNWERYGHPDGRQEISMGIALPKTIIEGRNRTLTLAVYGLIFGGMLPALVGRWWFGNREKTKDGVNARSAATFFKALTEESGIDDVVASLGKSFEYERRQVSTQEVELAQLEKQIQEKLGAKWDNLKRLAEVEPKFVARRRAFILLHAHLLRLSIQSSTLRKGEFRLHDYRLHVTDHTCRAKRRLASDSDPVKLPPQYRHDA